jgi:hypothetical protein
LGLHWDLGLGHWSLAQVTLTTALSRKQLGDAARIGVTMIRKLTSGKYRLYSRKTDPKTGKRRNLGTFNSLAAAKKHERAVQFFKRKG